MTGQDIVRSARTLIGTPFHDGARLPGVGLDCSGVVLCSYRLAGGDCPDYASHSRDDYLPRLIEALSIHARQVEDYEPGDVLVFRTRLIPGHCAIWTGDDLIVHAWNSGCVHRVIEAPIGDWAGRVHSVWRFKEIA